MQFVLLLHVGLLGLGLSMASPGRTFLMMFPPHNDPTANISHQVTIAATGFRTSVTVKVLESSFVQNVFLFANQSTKIYLPVSVGMTSDRSSYLLSVKSVWPVSVLASLCTKTGCDHSLLHDVSSWGTRYYPITPNFPNQTAVSQMVITSSDRRTSVDVFLSGDVLFEGNVYPRDTVLTMNIGVLESVYLQSNSSLSGSELISKEAVSVVVGFTCSKHTPGACLYGFAELKSPTRWSFDYIIPPLVNTGMNASFLLAMATINSNLDITASTGRKSVSLVGGVMKVIPVVTSDEIHITSDSPLQLVYFRHGKALRPSTLTVLPSVYDICQTVPLVDSGDMSVQQDNITHTGDLESGVKFFQMTNSTWLPDTAESSSLHTDTDVGHYLSTMNRQLYPAACEKTAASCEQLHCGHKRKCFIKDGKPLCSLKTMMCSAWGDSYYRTFDGRDFVLQGSCNYTLLQTTCPGSNASVPLQINVARAYLNSATVSTIHTVQISIQGFNISMIKEDKNHVRINGQKRNLPLNLGNGSLNFYPSGSSVVLDTSFGLTLQYDWKHHLQVEVGPQLYGVLCGLCGNANHRSLESAIASNDTDESKTVDFTLPWVVNSDKGSCIEDCGGVSCPVCTESQTKSFKGTSLRFGCTLLQRSNGPFVDCHSYIDPEPFVHSCVNNLCVNEAASSLCKILTAYANACQRLAAKVQNWRVISKCPMVCPMNSHHTICGSACPATCGDPEANRNCTLPCVESCECNRGFLLSGGKCVPHSQCGCLHQGSYYHPKETFWMDRHCLEECVCHPSSKRVVCTPSPCQDGEVCKVLNGVLGCHVDGPGVCIAKGDPHYTTFDGRNFDVHGNCTYIFTSYCPSWGDLKDFSVQVQNQREDATNVSFRRINMVVSGYSIEMSNGWRDRVMVNGLLLRLPSALSRGKVKLYMTGLSKYVETDFGVVVMYSSDVLTVQMPRIYSGNLCGLCGNFNADPEDDLMPDDGSDISQAVRYWQTSSEHECVAVAINTQGCNSQERALYEGNAFCLRLLDMGGAFQSCHNTVDPQDFYDKCVHDLCYSNRSLCQILSSYVAVCQVMGATVDEWRAPNFCDFSCPPNSEYHLCSSQMSDCGENHRNTSSQAANCKEGCFCRTGFFHSGGVCVPNSECGCIYNDVYFEIHENFYPDEHCHLHCVCVGHDRLQCTNHTCPVGTKCAVQDGQRACHASKPFKCAVMGGRHFRGYDGHSFDFDMGSCHYVLSQVCDEDESHPAVTIQQGQLHLRVHGLNLSLEMEHLGKVKIDGVLWSLPVQLDHMAIHHSGLLTRVVVEAGVDVTYGGPNLIQIVIPASHKHMCGLCGSIGDATDDKRSLNGSLASDVSVFAPSWSLSPPGTNCSETCELCSECNSTVAAEFASDSLCGMLLAPAGSFSGCHSVVDPEPFFQNCVNDWCVSNGSEELFCSSLRQYTFACQEAGAKAEPWRGEKCSLSCPENSHYNICVSACPESCGNASDIPCPWACHEGCQCESGYMQSGNGCVKAEQCGCFYLGHYYEASESKLLQNCTVNCTCGPPLLCKQHSCPALHSCVVSDGVTSCHEDAAQNPDPCEGKCDDTETCYLSNGTAVCESHHGLCWVWGGQHYHTFDGLNYDFEGTCTYVLAASKGATPFSVSKKNAYIGNRAASSAKVVTVEAYGFIIQLNGEMGSMQVNGQATCIPINLLRGKIQVAYKQGKALLTTDFGLHVLFDWGSTVLVTLDSYYKGKVYGLCGNFNSNPQDEYPGTAPGYPPNKTSMELAQVYQLFDGDRNCFTGCKQKLVEPTAHAEAVSEVVSDDRTQCAVLVDQKGPLAHCHSKVHPDSFYNSCVVDNEHNVSKVALDQAINSYTMVCEEASDGHHNEMTDDVRCPPNSHYKTCGSACPPSCEVSAGACNKICVQGCFCDPGFIMSQIGCVPPHQCGCTDSRGKYHNLNSTFWIPDDCGRLCLCGPATGEIRCRSAQCPRGMVCKQLQRKRLCQPENTQNCTIVTGLHFTTFDGHHFDFRDSCAYSLVQTKANLTGLTPFTITISDALCNKRLFYSLDLTLSIYGLEVVVRKDDPGKVLVDGLYKTLPYSHLTGHVNAYRTPSSIIIHTDVGLQLLVYNIGTLMVVLPSSYGSSVSGLCGNANTDSHDDQMMPNEELGQNSLEFAHSWRSLGAEACRSNCSSRPNRCPVEARELFEGSDFCGVLLNELGPFADCASVLSPRHYFHSCVTDSCSHNGHYSALCNSIAAYAAACQTSQLPVRQWRRDTFCGMSCPKNSHYELCGPRCPVVCLGLSSPSNCSGGCEEGCQCNPGYVQSDGQCVLVSDCGCIHEGQYRPAGHFYSEKSCQRCNCKRGEVTCSPMESCSVKQGLTSQHGVCQVFAGFGYITFDGVVLPHHGACTYVLSAVSSNATQDYTLLLSYKKDGNGTFTISGLVFRLGSMEVSIDPETMWKIQVNGEERRVPFDNGELKGYQLGNRLIIVTPSGVGIDLSSTQYLRLTVPQVYDATASGLCGNFNGDQYDDMKLRNGHLANNFTELLHDWAVVSPGQHCADICGRECDECRPSPHDSTICDILLIDSIEFHRCWNSDVERDIYSVMCTQAVCAGAGHMAACLALEAYSAACQANGIPVGSWRRNTPCSLQCPDRSSPRECVDSSSNSCPAQLQPGSSAAGCSEGCECHNGNVFDGHECVLYSQCGCIHHDMYIKMDEQLYTEDCTQRCWCHPLGGVLCEEAGCSPGQQCALRNGSWGCHDRPEVCELRGSLQVSTLSGQQLSLEPQLCYSLMSLCDKESTDWFSLISYYGTCEGRLVTVFQVLLHGSSFTIQEGAVKVNGHALSLPYSSPSGVSLTTGVNQDKSEVIVILRHAGMESALEMEIGVTMVTVKVPLLYSGNLCGLCGNLNDLHSHSSARSWVVHDLPGCGFTG